MARVEMHCIAAALGARFPGSRFCVSLLAIAAKLGLGHNGHGAVALGKIRFFFFLRIFGRLHITQSSKFHKSCHAVAFTYVSAEARARVTLCLFASWDLGPVYGANLILGASSFSPKRLKREASVMLADAVVRFC